MIEAGSAASVLDALIDIAARSGIDTTIQSVRRRFVIENDNLSNDAFIAVASELGMRARHLDVSWRELSRFAKALPSILHLRDGSALILESIVEDSASGQIAVLSDPTVSDAKAMVGEDQLASIWDGSIILIKRRYDLSDESQPFGLGWLGGQVLRERRLLRDISLAAILGTVFTIAPAFLAMIVIDRVITNQSSSTLVVIAGVFAVIVLFDMALGFMRRLFMEIVATRVDGRLNLYVLDRLLKLPMEFFEHNPNGLIMGKLGKVWQIRSFLTGQLLSTFIDMVTLVALIPALIALQWMLSIMVFACAGAIFLIVYFYIKPIGRLQARVVEAETSKGIYLTETVQGMRTIKSLALEGQRRLEWDRRTARAISARHAWSNMANYPQTLAVPFERMMFFGSYIVGAAIILGHPGLIYPGALMAFAMLSGRTAAPLVQLARLISDIGEVRSDVAEVASIMNYPPEDGRAGTGMRLPIRGDISFQNVQFRYSAGAPLALRDVSINIKPGTIFGIMGRSGSGKTTITRLLQGLNPNYEGIIKIDGMDLREIELNHLRTNVGVVAQENFLFSGTIRENISIARPDANFKQIVRAAQLAGAEEFIERMPRGYDTRLEEGATNLSGGQRQRLAIARALLIDPPVLILDEATSALDAESEAIINANLMNIAEGRTIICVSHRLSMLVPADAILVMERGEVYDIGRHEELVRRCDIYKHMWHQQNRHAEPAGAPTQYVLTGTASSN